MHEVQEPRRDRVVQLISLSNEFVDKVGREIGLKEKTFEVWMFMDEDTKAKAERKELVEGDSTFAEVCDFLEVITNEVENKNKRLRISPSSKRLCAWISALLRLEVPHRKSPPWQRRFPPRPRIHRWMLPATC